MKAGREDEIQLSSSLPMQLPPLVCLYRNSGSKDLFTERLPGTGVNRSIEPRIGPEAVYTAAQTRNALLTAVLIVCIVIGINRTLTAHGGPRPQARERKKTDIGRVH